MVWSCLLRLAGCSGLVQQPSRRARPGAGVSMPLWGAAAGGVESPTARWPPRRRRCPGGAAGSCLRPHGLAVCRAGSL